MRLVLKYDNPTGMHGACGPWPKERLADGGNEA